MAWAYKYFIKEGRAPKDAKFLVADLVVENLCDVIVCDIYLNSRM